MEQSSSYNKETIRHQFDRKCKMALKGEKIDYERHLSYRREHEILFCELPESEFWKMSMTDEYAVESYSLIDVQFDAKIKDELLAKAIETLTDRKKEVIFLAYFQGMSDAAIARKLNLVRSTVCEHRTRSLELLKNTMEEYRYENNR
jgi:RNA polymerase sigma factor (sigma-70 family)